MMKKISVLLYLFIIWTSICCSQEPHRIRYKDPKYMEYDKFRSFWNFKKQSPDGVWVVFYDSAFKDTAIMARLKNGFLEGLYRKWDEKDHFLEEESEYHKGELHGRVIGYYFIENQKFRKIDIWRKGMFERTIIWDEKIE